MLPLFTIYAQWVFSNQAAPNLYQKHNAFDRSADQVLVRLEMSFDLLLALAWLLDRLLQLLKHLVSIALELYVVVYEAVDLITDKLIQHNMQALHTLHHGFNRPQIISLQVKLKYYSSVLHKYRVNHLADLVLKLVRLRSVCQEDQKLD